MSLGKEISRLINRANGNQMQNSLLQVMTYKVAVDLDMFGSFMKNVIMGNLNSAMVITVKSNRRRINA